MKLNYRWLLLFATYVTFSSPAHAYLDPATGSIILQTIIGAVAAWVMYSKMYFAKAKAFVLKLFGRQTPQDAE